MSFGVEAGSFQNLGQPNVPARRQITQFNVWQRNSAVRDWASLGSTEFQGSVEIDSNTYALFNGRFKRIKVFVFSNAIPSNRALQLWYNKNNVADSVALTITGTFTGVFELVRDLEFNAGDLLGIEQLTVAPTGLIVYCMMVEIEYDFPALDFKLGSIFQYYWGNYVTNSGCCGTKYTWTANQMASAVANGDLTKGWNAPYDGEILEIEYYGTSEGIVPTLNQLGVNKNGIEIERLTIPEDGTSVFIKKIHRYDTSLEAGDYTFKKGDRISVFVDMAHNNNNGHMGLFVRYDP